MRPRATQTISAKLTRVSMLVSGTALLLAFVSFLAYDWYSLRLELVNQIETEAAITGANSVSALEFDDPQAAQTTLGALRGSPHVLYAAILTPDGATFAKYARSPRSMAMPGLRLAPNEFEQHWRLDGSVLLGRRIVFGGKTLGTVYVLAETTDLTRRAQRFGIISACILLLSFLIAVVATEAFRRLLTRPLTELARTAQVVSRERDYSIRATLPSSADELALLVHSFNEMLEQIQRRDRMLEESRTVLEQKVEERTAELKTANKELEAFSYSVAHDLRGPLQHISNIVFLLQQACKGDGETSALLEKLDESSVRMSKLIEDLLNLSRSTSTPLRRTEIDLSAMVRSILEDLAAQSPGRKVKVVVAEGARVFADDGLMRLAMENLLGNAWKYTSKIGEAEVEFGFQQSTAEGVTYSVRDNGAGFDPADAQRLFRPFQRLHTQEDFPGTGVGLATVQRILARHGGRIWAKADLERGAEFSFTIPSTGGEISSDELS